MSDAILRANIKTKLETVSGIGIVYDYERFAADDGRFIELFKHSNGKIMGWEITRNAVPKIEPRGGKFRVTHAYLIKGYYGLRDADRSEVAMNVIVDAVLLTFMSAKTTGAASHTLPRVNTIHARTFGQVLCHYAEIAIDVPEIVEKTCTETIADLYRLGLNYYLQPEHPVDGEVIDATDVVIVQEPPDEPA